MGLQVKAAEKCEFDLVALGECMIRLSPPRAWADRVCADARSLGRRRRIQRGLCAGAAGAADRLGRRAEYIADGPASSPTTPGRSGWMSRTP